jgi:hypothetical protein
LRRRALLLSGVVGLLLAAIVFASWYLGLTPLTVAVAGIAAAIAAALVSAQLAVLPRPAAPGPATAQAGTEQAPLVPLNFTALPAGGVIARTEGMARVEEELAIAAEYARPLALLLVGLDVPLGTRTDELEDRMSGLEEVVAGAIRAQDVAFQLGRSEVFLMLPETRPEVARVVFARIQQRTRTGLGEVRAALAPPAAGRGLAELLEELEEALELCRSTSVDFADPATMLQLDPQGAS